MRIDTRVDRCSDRVVAFRSRFEEGNWSLVALFLCQTKVNQVNNLLVRPDHHVAGLQVAMNKSQLVQIIEHTYDLECPHEDCLQAEHLILLLQHEVSHVAVKFLHDYIVIVSVAEVVVQLGISNNVLLVCRLHEFNLSLVLLLVLVPDTLPVH